MGTPLHHFCNREFTEELFELTGRNVLLLMIDGSSVFGRISRLCNSDCVVAVLPAIGISGYYAPAFAGVQFRPPNSTLPVPLVVSEVLIDVCDIAAVLEGPFIVSPLVAINGITPGGIPISMGSRTSIDRQVQLLEEKLRELERQNMAVSVLGGWTLSGQLGEIEDCIALIGPSTTFSPPFITLGAINVFGPAFPDGVAVLVGSFRAWINVKAVVQVFVP